MKIFFRLMPASTSRGYLFLTRLASFHARTVQTNLFADNRTNPKGSIPAYTSTRTNNQHSTIQATAEQQNNINTITFSDNRGVLHSSRPRRCGSWLLPHRPSLVPLARPLLRNGRGKVCTPPSPCQQELLSGSPCDVGHRVSGLIEAVSVEPIAPGWESRRGLGDT